MIDEATSVGTSPWPLSVHFGGLVDPSRLSCLIALRERPRTVREILAATDLSQPNISTHLTRLRESCLVRRTLRAIGGLRRCRSRSRGTSRSRGGAACAHRGTP